MCNTGAVIKYWVCSSQKRGTIRDMLEGQGQGSPCHRCAQRHWLWGGDEGVQRPGAGFSSTDISSIKPQQPVLRGLVSRLGDHSRAVPGQQRSLLPSRLVGWAGHQQ